MVAPFLLFFMTKNCYDLGVVRISLKRLCHVLNGKRLNFMRKLLIIVALSLYIGTFAQTSDLLIETICKSNPNKKEIVVDGKIKHNPFYRGYHYDDNSILDMLDEKQQIKGWEFLYSKDRKEMCKLYPFEFNYYIYDAAPNCMVSMYDGYGKILAMYMIKMVNLFMFHIF